jgi:2-dehydro-3-deoxygluconokinase
MKILPKGECQWDLLSLGEVMLRLDPGDGRVSTARTFQVWEGGGEYNVARGLKRCFGLRTSIVTAIVDNPVGQLVQDLIYQGGVDQCHILWVNDDGVGREARNGLNFVERGFGVRPAIGCSDRGHTAISQLLPGQIDWHEIFGKEKVRWFHTGGIFAALGAKTPEVAIEAMKAAKRYGTIVSYDLNYRPSLWKGIGGSERAEEVNRELAEYVDVMLGNEEDFTAALGFEVEGTSADLSKLDIDAYQRMIELFTMAFPNNQALATTLRVATSATKNDWSAILYMDGRVCSAPTRKDLEIFDRVGGGDSFASGLIYGLLAGRGIQWSVECGVAHGALAMTTPGDTTMATLAEVEKAMRLGTARVDR